MSESELELELKRTKLVLSLLIGYLYTTIGQKACDKLTSTLKG